MRFRSPAPTSLPWINLATPRSNYSAIDNNMKRTNLYGHLLLIYK